MALTATGRRTASLRMLVAVVTIAAVAYLFLFGIYVSARFGSASADLRRRTSPIPALYGEIAERAIELRQVLWWAEGAEGNPDRALLDRIRDATVERGNRTVAAGIAAAPPAMRMSLARADEMVARLQTVLAEYAGLVELGSPDADARLALADSLHEALDLELLQAQGVGVGVLVAQTAALQSVADTARRTTYVWFFAGLLIIVPLALIVWRRLGPPLAALERGLDRVGAGDLTVRLPLRRDDEVGRLTRQFNEMIEVLEERAESQGRFVAAGELLAGVAHEVNNPLMAITAIATNRLDEPADAPTDAREDMIRVRAQAHRASRLLSGLLRFVRRSPSEPAQLVSMNDVISSALELVSFRFPAAEIMIEEELQPRLPGVMVKPVGLEQVFVNLLSNAVQALTTVSVPRLIKVSTWLDQGMVHAAVEDSGPGIAPAIQARLFQPFQSTKGSSGTGLGLFISRQIAQHAGGDLRVESSPLGGARFILSLPVSDAAPPPRVRVAVASTAPDAHPLEDRTILLVDDEPSVRQPVAQFLRRRGAVVWEAGDGEEALAMVDAMPTVDVIVTDLRMPRLDGPSLWARLRAVNAPLAERMLFLSGDIQAGEVEALGPPADRMVLKPVELLELEERIRRLLGASSGR